MPGLKIAHGSATVVHRSRSAREASGFRGTVLVARHRPHDQTRV